MILTSRNDLDASIDDVYRQLTDVAAYKRMAARQDARIVQEAGNGTVEPGAAWSAHINFRGRERELRVEVTDTNPPKALALENQSGGMSAFVNINLVRLSPNETRMALKVKLKPRTLSARLIVQSLKLTRPTVTRKFTERVDSFAKRIEASARG